MIGAVILAAGQSRRMGRQKLLLPVPADGTPLVRRVAQVALASTVDRVVVVVDPAQPPVADALAGLPVELVANPDAPSGMGSSLRAAARRLLGTAISAAVFLLGDQPGITKEAIDALVGAHRKDGVMLAQASYEGGWGHPVLFARAYFAELADVTGDQGGREVIVRHRDRLVFVPVKGPAPVDIDTEEEYRRLYGPAGEGPE
jgi:molybdenum cofactor cytidylyltransferase